MAEHRADPSSLDTILITHELDVRPSRPIDREKENGALVALMQALADSPQTVLQTLADTILDALECGSAGVSLLTTHDGGKRFYWPAISGVWKQHIGGGTPREFGPCGTVLDQNKPLLFSHVEKVYTYFEPVKPAVEEALLVPFYSEGKAVGTVWAVAHDDRRKFDAEDKRQLETLARFASGAYQAVNFLESQKQFAAIVASSDDAIVSKDLNGIILSWNRGAERIFGYSSEEIVGLPITTIVPPELQQEERDILEKLRRGERIDHFETIRLNKNGSRVNVSLTISPVRDNGGNVVGASKIARDISERRRFEAALKESEFSARLLKVQDEDRRRIARELHDGVGQVLAAININVSAVAKEKANLSSDAARRVDENRDLIQQASADIRTVSYLLHPPLLDDVGLRSALEWYVDGFAERSKIAASLEFPEDLERLPPDTELVIFRIAQECLTNIHRHAKCSSAIVKLTKREGKLAVEISDDGHGISEAIQARLASGNTSGVGLRGMRERVTSIGGTFAIDSSKDGTSVRVTLPLEQSDAARAHREGEYPLLTHPRGC
jgi:PAS domain S-box-containing protein